MISKLPHVGTTIFTVMSKMAADYNAINISQGFPNFPVDARLLDIYQETIRENVHQYAPMMGHPLLMEELTQLTARSYQRNIRPEDELLVTAGATQAIFTIIQALIHSGDEIIVLDPAYDCYDPAILLAGGNAIHVNLDEAFRPDFAKIEAVFSTKTKMLIINNPHNPSGTVWAPEDFQQLSDLLDKYPNVLLLSDEVYEYITFDKPHISINTFEKIRERAIIVSSFGKTFHITGWKIGYLIAPKNLMIEIKKVHQFLVFCVNSVSQVALAKYLKEVDVSKLGGFYQEKRDYFQHLMKASRLELLPAQGSYFQTACYKKISEENDIDFAKRLVTEFGVATIPFSVFYKDNTDRKLIRLCYAKDDETLMRAAEKLSRI
jgi:methionine transaminase